MKCRSAVWTADRDAEGVDPQVLGDLRDCPAVSRTSRTELSVKS